MDAAELNDLFIITLARELRDGERVFVGANQADVALAAYLARRLWAPRLKVWAAGTAQLDRTLDPLMVGRSSNDNVLVQLRGASFPQARAFDDVRGPVVFAGGLQVDGRGNANLAGIRDAGGAWKLRGPGSAGLASLTTLSPRFYIQVPNHDPRTLVARCSAISVLGDPTARASVGLPPDALQSVITPLATFTPTASGLSLTGLAPGISREVVAQQTGFEVQALGEVSTRKPPSPAESAVLHELRAAMDANRQAFRPAR